MLVGQRVPDRTDPLADAQRIGVAERRRRQPSLHPTFSNAMSVSGSRTDDLGAEPAAVGQLHQDPLGPLDDVVVGEDVAVRLDDHAAAGSAARHVEILASMWEPPGVPSPSFGAEGSPSSGGGAPPSDVASTFTTAGFRRSATSAKLTSDDVPARRVAEAHGSDEDGSCGILPAPGERSGDDQSDEEEPAATSNTVTRANRRLMLAL